MSKNTIIKGTLILTIAGFATRFIGVFYKIYLAKLMGAEMMGVYHLVFPVYGICFTLYGSGLQTSISRLIAAERGKNNKQNIKKILAVGLIFSVSIALVLSILVYSNSEYIAGRLLTEPRSASSLRVLAMVFPFCGITACINGYYYGIKKASVPAASQLFEQIVRVLSVYIISTIIGNGDVTLTCELAVFGIVLGEIASNVYNIICFVKGNLKSTRIRYEIQQKNPFFTAARKERIPQNILKLAVPLTSNRLLISILQSFEAVLIPNMLKSSGLTNAEALSVYGILTGMSMPFIMFPSTITNSFAVMLLPAVSEAQAARNDRMIDNTTSISIKYSLLIGILSTGVFIIFGNSLGMEVYHNKLAGSFLTTLAWLCPFLYLTTTLGSIINGLGKAHITFFNTVIGLSIRILFILYLVPRKGIAGYLIGLLVSQLIISFLDGFAIYRNVPVSIHAIDWIVKPALIIFFEGLIIMRFYNYLVTTSSTHPLIILLLCCFVLSAGYFILLLITKAVSLKEFRR
ncbi:stage V sporulation protein B [Mobilisporobacter senegalensis]|uniref:Stage V sporulation protein B n=1 Tax=Mobilisporobacter senegalensis TaxID=1329262 RepID=A0A3N1Y0D3_9FIRM|nr:polysaccharide biosynthesis protein [Mobilisporobacter senegalensis]ROR30687.1 stage V sporulation protein B [Mobilisporobacter senegalensis]